MDQITTKNDVDNHLNINKWMEGKWVAEWSKIQGCFHVNRLDYAIRANARITLEHTDNDYQIFGIYDSRDEAGNACDAMKVAQQLMAERADSPSR